MTTPTMPEKVCSPLHRCFPPLPTICSICKRESGENCPFRKAMESDMERAAIEEYPLEDEDVRVIREAMFHAVQRGDVPVQDRDRMHHLLEVVFNKKGDHGERDDQGTAQRGP